MSKTVEEIHQIALKFEQGILKLHNDLKNDIIDGIQHGHRLGVLFEEHQEAINQLLIEAKIKQLDELIDINSNTFNKWTQNDIANFFHDVGRIYRNLQSNLKKEDR